MPQVMETSTSFERNHVFAGYRTLQFTLSKYYEKIRNQYDKEPSVSIFLMSSTFSFLFTLQVLVMSGLAWAEQPCDRYSINRQARCERLWKEINAESVAEMTQFGMDQLRRRQEGKITQDQHLKENTAFIKQSAEKRLRLLSERMGKE